MKPFFVFSLPRCRSSWLSVLLTTDKSLCLHDYWQGRRVPENLTNAAGQPYEYVGFANTSTLDVAATRATYPMAPMVIVHRDPEHCGMRLAEVLKQPLWQAEAFVAAAGLMRDVAMRARNQPRTMVIPFAAIDARAAEIYEFLLPGLPLDELRLEQLKKLRIQPEPDKMRAEMEQVLAAAKEEEDAKS